MSFLDRKQMPFSEYLERPEVSQSGLKLLLKSPLHYRHAQIYKRKPTAAMDQGTASHVAILEPEAFMQRFCMWDRKTDAGKMAPRRGQHWEAFRAKNAGKEVVTEDEFLTAQAMARSVHAEPEAMRVLGRGQSEVSMFWADPDTGIECKGRLDWVDQMSNVVVDVKTCRDASPIGFGRQSAQLGYHLQAAHYSNGYRAVTGRDPKRYVIVAIESTAPHDVVVYDLPRELIDAGREQLSELLHKLKTCRDSDTWPGIGEGKVQTLELPAWAFPEESNDISDLGLEVA